MAETDVTFSLKSTLVGALVGGALLGGVAVYQTLSVGRSVLDNLGLAGFMAFLGATVGGLAGPLMGAIIRRQREKWERRREEER